MRLVKSALLVKSGIFALLCALFVLTHIAIVTPAAAQDKVRWRMATSWPGGVFLEHARHFAERVETLTDGRVSIQVFPGGALGNPLKVSETVDKGIAQIGHSWTAYEWGKDKTMILFPSWPGGPQSSEALIHWYYEYGGLDLMQDYFDSEMGGLKVLIGSVIPAEVMHSKVPVRTLADFQGLSYRTTGAWMEIASDLGASTVAAAGSEVYQMLERGAVDATEWGTPASNVSMGFHEIAPYVIVPGMHQPSNAIQIYINPEAWEELSDQDRELVTLASKLSTFENWTTTGMADIEAIETFREHGNEIITLTEEVREEARALAFAWAEEQAAENEWFARVWQSQKDFMETWDSVEGIR